MHELGLMYEAAQTATRYAEMNDITQVKTIELEVGELTGVIPEVFENYFPYVAEQFSVLKTAELKLHVIPGQAICADCQCLFNVMKNEGKCPRCSSEQKTILSGQEIILKQISC